MAVAGVGPAAQHVPVTQARPSLCFPILGTGALSSGSLTHGPRQLLLQTQRHGECGKPEG